MNATGVESAATSTAYRVVRDTGGELMPAAAAQGAANGTPVQSQSLDFIDAVAAAPQPIDARKVAAIRNLIASGAYPINAHAIAAKMISLDLH